MAAATTRDSGRRGRRRRCSARATSASPLRSGGGARCSPATCATPTAARLDGTSSCVPISTPSESFRVPRVLAHLRQRRQGLNADGVRVVQEALESRGVPAVAELAEHSVRLRWQLESWPHVTIVIPTRHNRVDAVEGAARSRDNRLPVVRRPHHRQRWPVRGQRRVVRRARRGAGSARSMVDRDPVQLLAGEQRGRRRRARRGARLPQRRHRVA